ncbi:NAD-binding protein [Mycena alexandri]|uniref:NAD-binding protein n=1 Tax=Mycena alexandri TaxID=1745969 RepID=A0AAD6XA33_9AGAR|nr:NAD-binding protein [Mycena alexandri]
MTSESKGIAIVTGAGQGIGKAIALRLADDGFDIVVNDIAAQSEALAEVVDEIKAKGRVSSAHVADVSSEEEVRGMVEQVVATYGRLNVMVANAGICGYIPMSEQYATKFDPVIILTAEKWDRVMGVNARGTFLCYKYAGAQMIKQGDGGRIIGFPFNPAYSASKFAIRGLTQAAAIEYGPHKITVNAYAPGAIDTAMLPQVATAETPRDALMDEMKKMSPLGTVGVPADIANFVSFIASKDSQFITGKSKTISVNGGGFFD